MKVSYISYYEGLDVDGKVIFQGNGSHLVSAEKKSHHRMKFWRRLINT